MDSLGNTPVNKQGFYSVNADREFDETASALRYFKMPNENEFPIDLNVVLDKVIKKPQSHFYIVLHKSDFMNGDNDALISSTKYITTRGVLKKILRHKFDDRDKFGVIATKYKNNIYLYIRLLKPNAYENMKYLHYSAKLEQLCLTHDPCVLPDASQQIDSRAQFFSVCQRKLVHRDFLYASDMDGILSPNKIVINKDNLNDLTFIEVKTFKKSSYFFPKFKTLNTWLQIFLSGVNSVYFGMMNNGIVHNFKHFSLDDLQFHGRRYWSPRESFEYLDEFLNMVEDKMANIDCPHTVFEFDFTPEKIECTEHHGPSELSFLPEWYLKTFET